MVELLTKSYLFDYKKHKLDANIFPGLSLMDG